MNRKWEARRDATHAHRLFAAVHCACLLLAVHFIFPTPFNFALPFAMASPTMSPFIVRGRVPRGVTTLDMTLSDVPTSVPVTGASPILLLSVPLNFPPSWLIVAVAGTSPFGVLKIRSHSPLAPPEAPAGSAAAADAVAVVGDAAASARLAVQSPSPKPPNCTLPASVGPSALPVITTST